LELAVLQEWKDETLDRLVIREYEVIKPVRIRDGKIGPQLEKTGPNAGKIYPGGGHQYEVVENLKSGGWRNFLEEISPPGGLKLRSSEDLILISELKASGVKFSESDLKWVFKSNDGKIIFLEKGNINAGYEHILGHKNDFIAKGIAELDISDFIMKALKENKIVGYQGTGEGRPIYELIYNGIKQRVAITTSSNGFVVGANPTSF
jgi:hypothetical protein